MPAVRPVSPSPWSAHLWPQSHWSPQRLTKTKLTAQEPSGALQNPYVYKWLVENTQLLDGVLPNSRQLESINLKMAGFVSNHFHFRFGLFLGEKIRKLNTPTETNASNILILCLFQVIYNTERITNPFSFLLPFGNYFHQFSMNLSKLFHLYSSYVSMYFTYIRKFSLVSEAKYILNYI